MLHATVPPCMVALQFSSSGNRSTKPCESSLQPVGQAMDAVSLAIDSLWIPSYNGMLIDGNAAGMACDRFCSPL